MSLRPQNAELSEVNIVLFDKAHVHDRSDSKITSLRFDAALHPREFRHLERVLKAGNCQVKLGQIGGATGVGRVSTSSQNSIDVEIDALNTPAPAKKPITVLLALTRPKNLRRCLRSLANFGAESIHIFHSSHVEKSYWSSPLLNASQCRVALQEGLEVAGDPVFPTLEFHRLFRPFAEDIAPRLGPQSNVERFVCTPNEANSNDSSPLNRNADGHRVFVIGPEAGLTAFEIELLRFVGYQTLSLGNRVLTVENAIAKVLS